MNLYERAAYLLDEGTIANTCNTVKNGSFDAFYKQLEKSAKSIPGEIGLGQFRSQSDALTVLAMRALRTKDDPFVKCIMNIINAIIDLGDNEPVENLEFISWSKFMTFIKNDIDTISANLNNYKSDDEKIAAYAQRLAQRFFDNVVAADVQKHQGTKSFKHKTRMKDNATVKAAIDRFSAGLKAASNNQYDIVIQSGSKNAAPILIDYTSCLQLTASNYNEFAGFANATNMTDFMKMVENTFKNILGPVIGNTVIPEDVTFFYKGDALVACDWSRLTNSKGDFGGRSEAGIYKLSDGSYVHFLYNGMSRHSKSDAGMSYDAGESRYDNYFSDDKKKVTVALNMNSALHSGYTKDVAHYIFEIVDSASNENGYDYVSRGTYKLVNQTAEEVEYERTSTDIPRLMTAAPAKTRRGRTAPVTATQADVDATVEGSFDEAFKMLCDAELLDEAIRTLTKAGYKIIK